MLRTFIKNSMGLWKTTLEVNSRSVAQVNINCGIYQGDAISPLLFCIGLNLLGQIITKSGYGYKFKSGAIISDLLYLDDIKLYGKNERDIDSLIHLTRICIEDMCVYCVTIKLSLGALHSQKPRARAPG